MCACVFKQCLHENFCHQHVLVVHVVVAVVVAAAASCAEIYTTIHRRVQSQHIPRQCI